MHSCLSSCSFEANVWSSVTLKHFVFLFYQLNCNNKKRSEIVLNSHHVSSSHLNVFSPVTFSSTFCFFVCLCQFASELRFDGFSLRQALPGHSSFQQSAPPSTHQGHLSEVSPELSFVPLSAFPRIEDLLLHYVVIGWMWVMATSSHEIAWNRLEGKMYVSFYFGALFQLLSYTSVEATLFQFITTRGTLVVMLLIILMSHGLRLHAQLN